MAVGARTTCKRVVGPVVAAALMVGAVGVTAAPAQAAQTSGPADYASQAQQAADYIDSHQADLTKGKLGPQLDGALALVAAGRKDSPTIAKVKDTIKAQGPSYCTAKNVGGCAKVTITLLALGESTTYGGVDYSQRVTSLPASALNEYATNQALDMIALERLGRQAGWCLGLQGQGPECEHHCVGGTRTVPCWRCGSQGAGCGRPEVARESAAV